MGLVGESGCGKTTAARACCGCCRPTAPSRRPRRLTAGTWQARRSMRRTRWKDIAWISQAAMNALDPISGSVTDRGRWRRTSRSAARTPWLAALFREVGIDPGRLNAYPFEMSGGMKQRAVIAMALALEPKLIIADEPTTALDVVTQAQILARLAALRRDHGMALLFITHDISVVVQTCDTVTVMYAGKVMESGAVREVLRLAYHPYTMGLRNAFPTLEGRRRSSSPGSPRICCTRPQAAVSPSAARSCRNAAWSRNRCRAVAPAGSPPLPEMVEEFRARAGQPHLAAGR